MIVLLPKDNRSTRWVAPTFYTWNILDPVSHVREGCGQNDTGKQKQECFFQFSPIVSADIHRQTLWCKFILWPWFALPLSAQSYCTLCVRSMPGRYGQHKGMVSWYG